MRLVMLAIRDAKTEAYMTPFFAQSVGAAEREFADLANDAGSPVGKHPEDYSMFLLGAFDAQTGKVSVDPQALEVARALNLIRG